MRRQTRDDDGFCGVIVLCALLIMIAAGVGLYLYVKADNTAHTRVTTICSVETVQDGTDERYRAHSTDTGTYAIDASYLGRLSLRPQTLAQTVAKQTPSTFVVTYDHHRFERFTWYPNILSVRKIAADKRQIATCLR